MNLRYYVKTIRLLNLHCNRTDDNDDNNSPKLNKSFLPLKMVDFIYLDPN